jgi:hypothetical protein
VALIRSGIWDPDGWPVHVDSPMVAQVLDVFGGDLSLVPIVSAQLEQNYVDDL